MRMALYTAMYARRKTWAYLGFTLLSTLAQTSVLDSIFIASSWSTKSSPAVFFLENASCGGDAVAAAFSSI